MGIGIVALYLALGRRYFWELTSKGQETHTNSNSNLFSRVREAAFMGPGCNIGHGKLARSYEDEGVPGALATSPIRLVLCSTGAFFPSSCREDLRRVCYKACGKCSLLKLFQKKFQQASAPYRNSRQAPINKIFAENQILRVANSYMSSSCSNSVFSFFSAAFGYYRINITYPFSDSH
jgi:hypothetical protein